MKEKIIVEQHDLINIDLFDHKIIMDIDFNYDNFIHYEKCLFFDIENNIIGLNDFYMNIIFQSDNKVNLIDKFIKLFNIELNENECVWLHEINFNSNLLVSKDEIIGIYGKLVLKNIQMKFMSNIKNY